MSPNQFHAKQEQHDHIDQTPLKIHRLPRSSSTNSDILTNKPQHHHQQQQQQQQQPQPPRRPVIIYTHSPKVIHTHPRDFMALVQKLTGYTPPPEETQPPQDRRHHRGQGINTEDNESTSVVTEEHGSSVNDIHQVNSCFIDGVGVGVGVVPPSYRAATGYDPYFNHTPVFSNDFMCTPPTQQFYNPDSMFMNRNSSSSSLRVLKEYPDL